MKKLTKPRTPRTPKSGSLWECEGKVVEVVALLPNSRNSHMGQMGWDVEVWDLVSTGMKGRLGRIPREKFFTHYEPASDAAKVFVALREMEVF